MLCAADPRTRWCGRKPFFFKQKISLPFKRVARHELHHCAGEGDTSTEAGGGERLFSACNQQVLADRLSTPLLGGRTTLYNVAIVVNLNRLMLLYRYRYSLRLVKLNRRGPVSQCSYFTSHPALTPPPALPQTPPLPFRHKFTQVLSTCTVLFGVRAGPDSRYSASRHNPYTPNHIHDCARPLLGKSAIVPCVLVPGLFYQGSFNKSGNEGRKS